MLNFKVANCTFSKNWKWRSNDHSQHKSTEVQKQSFFPWKTRQCMFFMPLFPPQVSHTIPKWALHRGLFRMQWFEFMNVTLQKILPMSDHTNSPSDWVSESLTHNNSKLKVTIYLRYTMEKQKWKRWKWWNKFGGAKRCGKKYTYVLVVSICSKLAIAICPDTYARSFHIHSFSCSNYENIHIFFVLKNMGISFALIMHMFTLHHLFLVCLRMTFPSFQAPL